MTVDPPIHLGIEFDSFIPTPGARLSNTIRPELARQVTPFTCLTAEVESLRPQLYDPDPTPNRVGLYVADYDVVDREGLLSDVIVKSQGCFNNILPKPFWSNAAAVNSVTSQVTAVSTGDKVSISLLYMAPTTTYEWIEAALPALVPRYSGMQNSVSPLYIGNILRFTLTSSDGAGAWIPYSDFVAAFNSLYAVAQVTEYAQEELIPGYYWKCRSTTSWLIYGSSG